MATSSGAADRLADPAYYLISSGRTALERALDVRVPVAARLKRAYVRAATGAYLGTLALVAALLLAVPLLLSASGGAAGPGLVVIAILAIGPASDLAMALVNRVVTTVLGPRSLARLDLRVTGVPSRLRTLVVVPTFLTSEADVEAQVNGLEVHFLGNREGDIRFALLSDWLDAPTECLPGDDELLAAAASAIERLNERHGEAPGGGARFLLFHRTRQWNAAEGCWMGWERKRGKLLELNALLLGSSDDQHPHHRAARLGSARRRPLRGHARRRHAAADRRRRPPRRDDGPSAQPADVRSANRPGDPGLRHPAAADHLDAPGGARSVDLPAELSPGRPGSIRIPPPPPTSTRTCSARGASRARGSTTSRRSPRPWRAGCPRTRS